MPDPEARRARFETLFREHHPPSAPMTGAACRRRRSTTWSPRPSSSSGGGSKTCPSRRCRGCSRSRPGTGSPLRAPPAGPARRRARARGARTLPCRPRLHGSPGMTRRLDGDSELLGLVRRADPMLAPRVQAEAGLNTESALRRLAPEVDRPPASRRARRRRRRRPALRIAVLIGAVAAAAFVVANVASTGNGSAVSPAHSRTMIMRARAGLLYPKGRSSSRIPAQRSPRAAARRARPRLISG